MSELDLKPLRNASGIRARVRAALEMLRPPPKLPPSAWAEAHLYIPAGNAIPGQYRIANAPYQREPMDMFIHPDCRRVTLDWSAQVGKTLTALGMQGYAIDARPRSQMMMQPSQGDAQTWLETKFNPMIEASPRLVRAIAKPRGREGVNNQRMKSYPGGFLMLAWAGSAKTMRGRSAPLIVCDEVDGYERTDEGHPVSLLWQRAATFGDDRFLLEISTPTIRDASYIETSFLEGDQRRFHVPCFECKRLQVLKWEQVTWVGRQSVNADDFEKDAHDDHKPETARYACEHCGAMWNDGQRAAAIRNAEREGGGWIAAKPFKGHASYHLWEAYSLFRKLGDIVTDYLAKVKTDDIQTFVNVSLAETFEVKGDKVDPAGLVSRAEDWAAPVPTGGVYLTAGVDMQQDRLEVEIVAWGIGEESWSVGYFVLWGDPITGEVWDELEDLLREPWEHESGARLYVQSACVDTGGTSGYTQKAYEWLRGKTGRRIFGIKGHAPSFGNAIVQKAQKKQSGKNARKVDLYIVAVDEAKLIVTRRFAQQSQGPGYCHVPKDRHDLESWANQVAAEKLVTRYVKGHPVREWHKPDKARNEALDCRVYAYAALKITAPNLKRLAEKIAAHPRALASAPIVDKRTESPVAELAADTPRMAPIAPEPAPEPKPERKRPKVVRSAAARNRGGFVGRY